MENKRVVERLVAVLTMLLVLGMAARYTIAPDSWWHLRAGAWIWEHRALPGVDHFSYTRVGEAWHYPGWPMELVMLALYRLGGLGALNLGTALTVTLTWAVVWKTIDAFLPAGEGPVHPLLKAGVVTWAAAASAVYWAARPYLLTFLLSAVFLAVLARWRRRGGRLIWVLPLLMVLWVNGHGGFIMGWIWWGVYWVAAVGRWLVARWRQGQEAAKAAWRRLLSLTMVGGALVVAVAVNPYGMEMYAYPWKTISMQALHQIAEWQPPDFSQPETWPFLALLVALMVVLGLSARRMRAEEAFLTAGMSLMALTAARNIALFAVALAPVMARHAEALRRDVVAWLPKREPRTTPIHRKVNLALVGLAAFVAFAKAGVMALPQVNAVLTAQTFPVAAVQYLETEHPPGRLFNDYNWGGYLLWAAPDYPVFVDGRTDLYGDDIIEQWLRVMAAQPGWQAVLDYWDVRLVLVRPEAPLASALPNEGWHVLYQDDLSVLYGR